MNTDFHMSRRRFLKCAAAGLAASCLPARTGRLPPLLPGEFRRGGMVYRPLGKTGMNVSLLAFGSHTDRAYKLRGGIRNVLNAEGQARRDRQISKAIDLGVNLIDVYEHEGQWEPLAKLLKPKRDKVMVAGAYDNPEFIGQNIDRLAKLYGGYIDLYRIRSETVKFDSTAAGTVGRASPGQGGGQDPRHRHRLPPGRADDDRAAGTGGAGLPDAAVQFHPRQGGLRPVPSRRRPAQHRADRHEAAGRRVDCRAGSAVEIRHQPGELQLHALQLGPGSRAILPAAVAELAKTLNQLPDETLPQAAMRYVYSKQFLSATMTGMVDDQFVMDNYAALSRYDQMTREEHAALDAARKLTRLAGAGWLPENYQWLEEQWRA